MGKSWSSTVEGKRAIVLICGRIGWGDLLTSQLNRSTNLEPKELSELSFE